MAHRSRALGAAMALAALALVLGPLAAVGLWAGRAGMPTPGDWAAFRFTLWQAAASAALSCALAVPLARALMRRRFPGRKAFLSLIGAPFILPVIVAIFGLVAIFGRNGWINAALAPLGLPPLSIYGPQGVILAHVFFNLPLACRMLLSGYAAIPGEHWRLAEALSLPRFRFLEWPMLRQRLPGAALLIFLICLTSFAVALTLGGGPRATTMELAIYQALRFEFDLGKAALMAVAQCAVCLAALGLAGRAALAPVAAPGLGLQARLPPGPLWLDAGVIGLAGLFLALPLAAVVASGATWIFDLPPTIWWAALRSIVVALAATALAMAMALVMARAGGRLAEVAAALPLSASSLVTGTGIFIILFRVIRPEALALPATVLVNALVALPFAYRILRPALAQVEADYGRLADQLGLGGLRRWRLMLVPLARGPIGFAAGLIAAMAMGDLGVIALFASQEQQTLPLAMSRAMGAYRMGEAAGAGLLLVLLAFGMFWIFDRGGRDVRA
ncbi:thiamine/thiamine pyrophosphate ABC transporter permease ThiP [Pseudoroseicyclus sp. CXY001]|uniref:thiamine/thiamine pyrophosphate ABC transporter permease ThiP n=1 Tax=Pseudoroseicyclus sp. CXY001 TaxID=3242492 RepID=UPI003570FFD8